MSIPAIPLSDDRQIGRDEVGVQRSIRYAGFWIRVLAFVLDTLILTVIGMLLLVIAVVFVATTQYLSGAAAPDFSSLDGFSRFAPSIIDLIYYVYFPASRWQATPGKRICRIYIIRVDGGRVTAWLALGRLLAYLVSALPLFLGYFMIGWTKQKTALHDLICGTRVVYGRL